MLQGLSLAWTCRVPIALVFAYGLGWSAGHGGTGLHLPAVAQIAAPAPAAPAMPPGQRRVMPATALFADVPPGGWPHSVYTPGNCTWWAAYNRHVPAWAPGGDAWQWLGNARRDGIATSAVPSVGAIVVYRAGATYSAHGHVGIVVALGVGGYRVSEMNYVGLGVVDEREAAWPDGNVAGFIPR